MNALLVHIQHQQDTATALCGILDALAIMDGACHEPATLTGLIVVAGKLAASICRELDSVRLPEGGEA